MEIGTIHEAVLADLDDIAGDDGEFSDGRRTLAATALRLAVTLDGDAGLATAAVARELRETMGALMGAADDDDAARKLEDLLSTPVGDSAPD